MLANAVLKGYNVYCCLAAPSTTPRLHSHWLLCTGSESADINVMILILNLKYQTSLILSWWPWWVCVQFRRQMPGSVNPDHMCWTTCFEYLNFWIENNNEILFKKKSSRSCDHHISTNITYIFLLEFLLFLYWCFLSNAFFQLPPRKEVCCFMRKLQIQTQWII